MNHISAPWGASGFGLVVWSLAGCAFPEKSDPHRADSGPARDSLPTDADHDGYSDEDCDDTDVGIHPGAMEGDLYGNGDGIDNDCDGVVDNDTLDGDDDGDGYAEREGDCDDEDPELWPGAVEILGDEVDQNCDGSGADHVERMSQADASWVADAPYLNVGTAVSIGDLSGDGAPDVVLGALDYSEPHPDLGDSQGRVYFSSLGSTPSNSTRDAFAGVYTETSWDDFGGTLISGVDLDDDGYEDALFGTPTSEEFYSYLRKAYLALGPLSGRYDVDDLPWSMYVPDEESHAGYGLAMCGIADGWEVGSAIIGDPRNEKGGEAMGYVWQFSVEGMEVSTPEDALGSWYAEQTGDYAGEVLAMLPDMDGDGVADLAIGATLSDNDGGLNAGTAYVTSGQPPGLVSLADAAAGYEGTKDMEYAGSSLASVGDVNGDGYSDLAIGGSMSDEQGERGGKAYLVLGPHTGRHSLSEAVATITPESAWVRLGYGLASLDLDTDAFPDLAVSAPMGGTDSMAYPGKVYVFASPLEGTYSGADADLVISGEGPGDEAGLSLCGGRDLNADGWTDLVIGAPYNDEAGEAGGKVYAIFGGGL